MSIGTPEKLESAERGRPWLDLLVGVIAFAVYALTLAPTAMWGDSAKYVVESRAFEWTYHHGLHPSYAVVSACWQMIRPIGNEAVWLNLFSGVCGAIAAVLITANLRVRNVRPFIARGVGLAFALSHVHWHTSVIAETQSFGLMLFLGLTLIHTRTTRTASHESIWTPMISLFAIGAATGLLTSTFLLGVAFGGALGLVTIVDRWSEIGAKNAIPTILIGTVGFAVGFSPAWIPLFAALAEGSVPADVVMRDFTGAEYARSWFWEVPGLAAKQTVLLAGVTAYQFPSLLLLGVPVALYFAVRKRDAGLLGLSIIVLGSVAFASTYMIQRALFVLVPAFACCAILAGVGLEIAIRRRASRMRLVQGVVLTAVFFPLIAYPVFMQVLEATGKNVVPARPIAHRDAQRYFLYPPKNTDDGPLRFATETFELVPAGGAIIADFTPMAVLLAHSDTLGAGRTLLFSEGIGEGDIAKWHAKYNALYTTGSDAATCPAEELGDSFELQPEAHLFRIVPSSSRKAAIDEGRATPSSAKIGEIRFGSESDHSPR